MTIEAELKAFLDFFMPNNGTKERNTEAILYFLGFRSATWPTLEETAIHFQIGTRERVRQIVDKNYKRRVKKGDLKQLHACSDEIESKSIWTASEISQMMQENGWTIKTPNVCGIIVMLHTIGKCSQYGMFDANMEKISRERIDKFHDFFIIRSDEVPQIQHDILTIQKMPGQIGLVNTKFFDDLETPNTLLTKAVTLDPDAWIENINGEYFYCYENRENVILNFAGRAFQINDVIEIDRLAAAYEVGLKQRTTTYPFPPIEAIKTYICESKLYNRIDEKHVSFNGALRELNPIDRHIIQFLGEHGPSKAAPIRKYLNSLGYSDPHIIKSTNNSPLIYIDKSQGKYHHTYGLVADPIREETPVPPEHRQYDDYIDEFKDDTGTDILIASDLTANATDENIPAAMEDPRYNVFVARLQTLIETEGTDTTVESTARREQSILSEWLFENKQVGRCALCGEEHDVSALITAHKKKRALCTEKERIDPYIVMPLCVFGCDYLYEHGHVHIENGTVIGNPDMAFGSSTRTSIEILHGRRIDDEWLKGDPSYFIKCE